MIMSQGMTLSYEIDLEFVCDGAHFISLLLIVYPMI